MDFYKKLIENGLAGITPSKEDALKILIPSQESSLLLLLNAALEIREHFYGRDVLLHILNNLQNGLCSEDCFYCAQSKSSQASIEEYPMKSDEEILSEARQAFDAGAFRHCMVFSGRGPSEARVQHLCQLIQKIKAKFPTMEICASAGFVNSEQARQLKAAGLNRMNHNLNTSERFYPSICNTHTYQDRLDTIHAASDAGLSLCSGVIIGMGESHEDILELALTLNKIKAASIPVNFYIPIKGTALKNYSLLTPDFCLRVLCLFRFFNPSSDIRIAAGRECHLRDMQAMALYPATSLFMDGYLNVKGNSRTRTLQMIKDAGFQIKTEQNLNALLMQEEDRQNNVELKQKNDLRPFHNKEV